MAKEKRKDEAPDRERDRETGRDRELDDRDDVERGGDDPRDDERKGLGKVAARMLRAGAGAFLDRAVVPELPKEVALYLLRLGEDVRDDILRIFGRELRRVLETMNIGEELQKILTSTSFEIKTEIRFIPNDQSVIKNIRNTKIRMKRVEKDGSVTEEDLDGDGIPDDLQE